MAWRIWLGLKISGVRRWYLATTAIGIDAYCEEECRRAHLLDKYKQLAEMVLEHDTARSAVDWLKELPVQDLFTLPVLVAIAAVLSTAALYYVLGPDSEAAVLIDVTVPEVCRNGFDLGQLQTLDEPSIQVS